MKYRVNGKITLEGGEPEMPLYVFVSVGNEVDAFQLEGTDVFTTDLELPAATAPPSAEVWIVGLLADGQLTWNAPFRAPLDPGRWVENGANSLRTYDFEADVSWDDVERWGPDVLREEWAGLLQPYTVRGLVYAELNGQEIPVPNARVEIIEYDPARRRAFPTPPPGEILFDPGLPERRDTLGVRTTDDAGEFELVFTWYPWESPEQWPFQPDWAPDLVFRVTQTLDGHTLLLAETTVMSVKAESRPKIEVPADQALLPRPKLPRLSGTYQSIGYLPVDASHVDADGYANARQPEDFITCNKAPFGGLLDVYARFADPKVTHYRFRWARWRNGAPGQADFRDVTDPLSNYHRARVGDPWRRKLLGPVTVGTVDNLYQSLDQEDPNLWHFEELKLRWNTEDPELENGKYTLLLEGYRLDAATGRAAPVPSARDSLVLRLDNTRPIARIRGLFRGEKPINECAMVFLKNDAEQLEAEIEVTDPEGHLGEWSFGTRYGRGRVAGPEFAYREVHPDPSLDARGPGIRRLALPRTAGESWPKPCAYAFELFAVGRSTNGKGTYLSQQRVHFQETLYIGRKAPSEI